MTGFISGKGGTFAGIASAFSYGKPGTDGTFSDNFAPPMARLGRVV
jgi:hypothetical protein